MSHTIQCSPQARLFQQKPSSLINAIESHEFINIDQQPSGFHRGGLVLSSAPRSADAVRSFVTGSITGAVVLIGAIYPTGGLTITDDEEAGRINPEWISSDASTWARWVGTTKSLLQRHELKSKPIPSAAAMLRVERLTRLQAVLGIPMQAMASALGITRQGLYKWLDATKEITLQEASRQRLAAVEHLAKLWSERSRAPLASVIHEPVKDGRTVLQMLADANLDEDAISSVFDELAKGLQGKPKSLSQRMAEAGFKRRSSAKALPADE